MKMKTILIAVVVAGMLVGCGNNTLHTEEAQKTITQLKEKCAKPVSVSMTVDTHFLGALLTYTGMSVTVTCPEAPKETK